MNYLFLLCMFPLGSDVTFPFFSALALVELYSLRTGTPLLLLFWGYYVCTYLSFGEHQKTMYWYTWKSPRKRLMHNHLTSGSHSNRFLLSLQAHILTLGHFLFTSTKFKTHICQIFSICLKRSHYIIRIIH